MKKRLSRIVVLILGIAILAGCQKENDVPEKTEKIEQQLQKITIYTPNEVADGFITETTETSDVTGEWITEKLIEKEVLPTSVEVLSCEKTEEDGFTSLNLDLNTAFEKHVQSMGTAGEYVTMGSVVNTFLDAFGCEQIKITVEGHVLVTGHAEYRDFMTKFE